MSNRRFLGLAAALVGILVGGLLAEGTVRLVAAVSPALGDGLRGFDPTGVQIEPHGQLGYRQRPNSVLHYFNGTTASANALGFRGPVVPIEPAPGTVRIILLGGSTTHGYAVSDDQTIDAHMRTLLRARYPTQHFEVVNLALDGYDTHQMLERLQSDGLRLHPSIVILNEGINDVRNAWYPHLTDADPRTLIWEPVLKRLRAEQARGGPTPWTLVKHYSYVARVPGYIRSQLQRRAELKKQQLDPATSGKAATPTAVAGDSGTAGPPYPDAANVFERNVRRMVAMSLGSGAAVLLSTPPSALRSFAPTATSAQTYWVWNAAITQDYRDTLAARLRLVQAEESRQGHAVQYVKPIVPLPFFLDKDDCHLKSEGNRVVAESFVDAITPLLPDSLGLKP